MAQVIKEFGCRHYARDKQMISGAGAGDIEQVAFGVIDLLEIRVVADSLNAFLQGDDFVITRHHGDGSEFQTFREVHGAD